MTDSKRAPRRDTRGEIQETALRLFVERGYEHASMREIAEELGITKAALYYHFRSKEDIIVAVSTDLGGPIDDLIAWGTAQPRTMDTRRELLRRYSEVLSGAARLFHLMQENQAALRSLQAGRTLNERITALGALMNDPDASVRARVRMADALLTVHFGALSLTSIPGDPEEKRLALLDSALNTLESAQPPGVTR